MAMSLEFTPKEYAMDQNIPTFIETLDNIALVAVPVTFLAGAWLAVRRSGTGGQSPTKTFAVIAAIFLGWFAAALVLGRANAFAITADQLPRIQFAILSPILIGLVLLLGTRQGRALTTATPQSWLVGVQVYRALGFMFLVLWVRGQMPGEF